MQAARRIIAAADEFGADLALKDAHSAVSPLTQVKPKPCFSATKTQRSSQEKHVSRNLDVLELTYALKRVKAVGRPERAASGFVARMNGGGCSIGQDCAPC
jgi:hypothetical protein